MPTWAWAIVAGVGGFVLLMGIALARACAIADEAARRWHL